MFSRNRYQLLLKCFHLVNSRTVAPLGHPEHDPCGKFNFFVEHANIIFSQHYIPNQQLNIDESLVGTYWQTIIKQYLPN